MADIYALVKNGVIIEGPKTLPINWENVSNLPALTDAQLLALGWYPSFLTAAPAYDNLEFKLVSEWVIGDTSITQTHTIVALTQQEKDTVQFNLTQSLWELTASALLEIDSRSRDKVNEFMGGNHELFQQQEREIREIMWRQDAGQNIKQGFYPTVKELAQDEGVSFGQYVQAKWDDLQPYYTQSSHVETRRRKAHKLMKTVSSSVQVDYILANLGY